MNRRFNLFSVNLLLAVGWAAVTGSFWWLNLLFGFVVGFAALWVAKPLYEDQGYFRRFGLGFGIMGTFLKELVLSSLTVAAAVLAPRPRMSPGIIAVPLDAKHDAQITAFANLVTLTPGTLSLDVDDDRRTLYVHAMFTEDPEELKQTLKDTFERKLIETGQ